MRLPTKQPVKLPTKLHPVWGEHIQRRDFLTLSGTTDGVLFGSLVTIPASADFSISWRGQWPANGTGYLFGNTAGTNSESDRIAIGDGPKLYGLNFQGAPLSFSASDRSIHTFLIERLDGNVSFRVDGVIKATSYYDPVVRVNSIGMKFGGPTSTPPFSGVVMDFKITIDGIFSNYWSINTAGDTILDVVGGNHGTLINGSSSDWERFEKAPGWDYWLGMEELFIPSSMSASWTDNEDGSYTKNANAYGQLGESTTASTTVLTGNYLVSYFLDGSSLRMFTRSVDDTSNLSYPLSAGYNEIELFVPLRGIVFDDQNSLGETISNISIRKIYKEVA